MCFRIIPYPSRGLDLSISTIASAPLAYRVVLSRPVTDPTSHVAWFPGSMDAGISIAFEENRPTSRESRPDRWPGTLVTSVQATLAGVKNEAFDAAMGASGEVVKPTHPQNICGQKGMNGKRYCVVDLGDKTIPGTKVLDIRTQKMIPIHLRYKGQQWWCRRCDADHFGQCKYLKKFYATRDRWAAEQIQGKWCRIPHSDLLRLSVFEPTFLACQGWVGGGGWLAT